MQFDATKGLGQFLLRPQLISGLPPNSPLRIRQGGPRICFLFRDGFRDIDRKVPLAAVVGSPIITREGYDNTAGNDAFVNCGSSTPLKKHAGAFTFLVRAKGVANDTIGQCLFGFTGNSGSRGTAAGPDDDGITNFSIAGSSTARYATGTTNSFSSTAWTNIAFRYTPSQEISQITEEGIIAQNTSGIPSACYVGNGLTFKIGNRGDTTGAGGGHSYFKGVIAFFAWTPESLPTQDIVDILRDAYAIFEPPPIFVEVKQSTAVALSGAALMATTASGTLSTSIALLGSAATAATGAGNLSISVRLSGNALAAAVAQAGLSTGIALIGDAQAQAVGTGNVVLQIRLAGNGIAQAAGSGQLTLTTDGGVALIGDAKMSATGVGTLGTEISLVGAAVMTAAGVGDLVIPIPLTGAAAMVSTAVGSLNINLSLSGAALARAAAAGQITTRLNLSGAAVSAALASGLLTVTGAHQRARAPRLGYVLREAREGRV